MVMHEKVQNVCSALNKSADECDRIAKSQSPDEPMIKIRGWHHPAITPNEITKIPRALAVRIEKANISSLENLDEDIIDIIPSRLELLHAHKNIQHVLNGNAHQALSSFLATFNWVESVFMPVIGFDNLEDPGVPKKLRRKINALNSKIENLELETKNIEQITDEIQQAHETAESLPTDLAELRNARKDLEKLYSKIEKLADDAQERSDTIQEQSSITQKLLEDSEDAYSISVTKGLSGAFHKRAIFTWITMWVWVCVLIGTLYIGFEIGSDRLSMLSKLISEDNTDITLILIQLTLSLIGLGAPIWLAWLSTKQIGQNSRLSEDYHYKASVAKAYEGYRREAARIDPIMEARLMHSALNRLDESPLRHVDEAYHSTPWQELISAPEFQQAIQKVPELKNLFLNIINKSLPDNLKK